MNKKEWTFILVLSFVVMLISSISYIYGYLVTPENFYFSGARYGYLADTFIYLQNIQQIIDGHFLIYNYNTLELSGGTLNVAWLGIGLLARLIHLGPALGYHIVRVLLIPIAVMSLYVLVKELEHKVSQSMVVTSVIVFFGGFGGFVSGFNTEAVPNTVLGSIDIWQYEFTFLQSVTHSPHFIVSWIFLCFTLLYLLRFSRNGRYRDITASGILGLFWLNFHPFYFVFIYPFILVLFLTLLVNKRHSFRNLFYAGILFIVLTLPSFFYTFFLYYVDPQRKMVAQQNVLTTPPLIFVILGAGVVGLLALLQVIRLFKKKSKSVEELFLLVWVLIIPILIYLPLLFQRRMLMGWIIPLSVLGVRQVIVIGNKYFYDIPLYARYTIAGVLLALCVLPVHVTIFNKDKIKYDEYITYGIHSVLYYHKDMVGVMNYLRENNREQLGVIGRYYETKWLNSLGGQRIFAGGHYIETIDAHAKEAELESFFNDIDFNKASFMREQGITYIVVPSFIHIDGDFEIVYSNEMYVIYKVTGILKE